MIWTVETFSAGVAAELDTLPTDIRTKLDRYIRTISAQGPQALPHHAFKHLEGKLWELRIIGRDGIARVIYVTLTDRRLVLLRAFVKKTQKTPLAELELARSRAKSLT